MATAFLQVSAVIELDGAASEKRGGNKFKLYPSKGCSAIITPILEWTILGQPPKASTRTANHADVSLAAGYAWGLDIIKEDKKCTIGL